MESKLNDLIFGISWPRDFLDRWLLRGSEKFNELHSEAMDYGIILSLLKIVKYFYLSLTFTSVRTNIEELQISMPYARDDVVSYGSVMALDNIYISWNRVLPVALKSIVLTIYFLTFKRSIKPGVICCLVVSYIFYERIKSQKSKIVHFYGYSYVAEITFLAIILTEDSSLTFHFHESANYIDDYSIIDCDVIHFNTEITRDYAVKYKHKYRASEYLYTISNDQLSQKRQKRLERDCSNKEICIGLYSEGYYARGFQFAGEDDIKRGVEIEKKILSFFEAYAEKHSSIKFVVYPHYTRGIETEDAVSRHYSSFLKNDNCRLNPIGKASSAEFEEVDLGVVIRSNIFWDRMLEGHLTILINPFLSGNFINDTIVKEVEFDIEDLGFEKKINSFLLRHFHRG